MRRTSYATLELPDDTIVILSFHFCPILWINVHRRQHIVTTVVHMLPDNTGKRDVPVIKVSLTSSTSQTCTYQV